MRIIQILRLGHLKYLINPLENFITTAAIPTPIPFLAFFIRLVQGKRLISIYFGYPITRKIQAATAVCAANTRYESLAQICRQKCACRHRLLPADYFFFANEWV